MWTLFTDAPYRSFMSVPTPRPNLRRQQGERSRERLLDAAMEVIGERGYAAAGVDEICRRAGVVKSALYWHFGSKETLLGAVIERVAASWVEEIQKRVYLAGDPLQRMDRFVEALKELAKEQTQLLRLLIDLLLEQRPAGSKSRRALLRAVERVYGAIQKGFADALGAELPEFDLIATLSMAYLHEAVVHLTVAPESVNLDRIFGHLRQLILLDVERQLRAAGLPPLVPPGSGTDR